MTLDWPTADTSLVHPSGTKKRLDIYFQPALAWIPAGTQGVALLFIENFTDSPDEDKQDFRELVKSLFRWAWRTADGKTEPVSQSTLEELYALFVENPFSYSTLNSFLGNNFEFHFQECTAEMQGALFPMFPELSMVVGTGPEQAFSVAAEQLDQAGMQAIKDYFNALKVQFDPASTASKASTDTQTIPAFIFNDYARVLTRNILQRAIDYMEGFPDVISKATVLNVVTETANILNQPDSITVIEGNNALLSVTASGANIAYRWQVDNGNGFQDISDGGEYSGALTDSLTVLNPTLQMSGRIFRCVATTVLTIEDLLTALDTANPYQDIAGMVSRFLMHGLHLPAHTYAAGGSAAAQALYQATHQQFTFANALVQVPGTPAVPATDSTPAIPAVAAVDEYRMTLKDMGDPSTAHFIFPEEDENKKPQIVYTIENDLSDSNPKAFFLELANQMQALDNSDTGLFHIPNPKLIPWYRMQALHFALRKQVEWALSDGSKQYLLQLPGSLITHLKLKSPNPTVSIKVWPNGDPNREVAPTNDKFTWATRIDLPIQRIINPETGEYLSQTYAFTGTSEAEKDLLEAVWARDEALYPIHLHLLYAVESGSAGSGVAVLPVAPADILLIKANLSTDDADSPADLFSASLAEGKNFLQLIWEGSTVISGGYYLYFPGITDDTEQALFNGGATATLQLILEFTNDDDPIHDFNNTAIFTENYSPDTNLILAESTEKAPILAIPPGFLGFQIDDLSEPAADADSAQDEVKNLYQLLAYKVVGHTRFAESHAGLPIGPTAPDPEASNWLYEKLIPTFSCVSGNTPLPLLDSPPDPYLGVGKDTETEQEKAELKIELWWQDLYGNQSQPPHLYYETFKVRYTDPLIGINQWPSVNENFEFVEVGDTVMLNILLSFDPSPYELSSHAAASDPATSQKNRIKGDREAYQKIYYQMVQNDISFSVGASLDTTWTFTNVDKALLIAFIEDSYLYLNDLMNDRAGTAPASFLQSIDASGITVKKEFIFEVTVNMYVSRDFEYIHDDLKKSKSLKTLADENSTASLPLTASSLVLANENRADIIIADLSLIPAGLSVETDLFELDSADWDAFAAINTPVSTQAGDTLARLAGRFGTTMTAALDKPVTFSTADLAAILANVTGLLAVGASIGPGSLKVTTNGEIQDRHAPVLAAQALLTPKLSQPQVTIGSGETLNTLAAGNSTQGVSYTAKGLVLANARNTNLLNQISLVPASLTPVETDLFELDPADWDAFVATNTPVPVQAGDTLEVLASRFETTMAAALGRTVKFSTADLAAILANVAGLLAPGASINLGVLNLRQFAANFETAFSGLHLAVSEDRSKKNQPADTRRPLYAVQMGTNGIRVDIKEAEQPFYYAIPPLSNTLLADKVFIDDYATWQAAYLEDSTITYNPESGEQQFDGIDVNVLARDFLVAVEDFLDPDNLVSAHRLSAAEVENILKQKANLASAISGQVLPILANQKPTPTQEAQAKEAIRQQLLLDLVKGYDIETIVQHNVGILVNSDLAAQLDWAPGFEPRLNGKARVVKVWKGEDPNSLAEVHASEVDFSLSTGKINLAKASADSSFTYLFDTKTPEKYANLHFQLEFITSELEYDIEKLTGITAYEASNWLSFILPENLTQPMGTAPVPIPLRNYPIPASLILQQAEADPSSLTQLADVRQWKYTIVYEHLDVAQDSIDCILEINVIEESGLSSKSALVVTNLFQALVNFGATYPLISNDLSKLKEASLFTDTDKQNAAKAGIVAFDALISQIAAAWAEWDITPNVQSAGESDLHYEVSEEPLDGADKQALVTVIQNLASKIGGPDPVPTLELPGYKEKKPVVPGPPVYTFTYEVDAEDLTFFGDSSIPDRKLMIENLDVIEHQNAWAKIWLSRNKNLIFGQTTNPAFIFQTPAVRFTNMVTPFITNDEPWDIATLSAPPEQPLLTHLTALIEELFPKPADINYEVRLSCRYAFALATGKGLNMDLKPTLPLLMGLRLNPKEDITLNGIEQNLLDAYPGMLEKEIKLWFTNHNPSQEEASIIFSVNLFSKLKEDSTTSLPMLRIKHLELKLEDVTDL